MNCRPRDWKVPKVGDDALVCQTCGLASEKRKLAL